MPIPVELPISSIFSKERIEDVHGYGRDRIQSLVRGLRGIREQKVSQWRKVYDGTPREKTKSFPWQNACLTLDTEVLTSQGWKPVASVTQEDRVYSADMNGVADFHSVTGVTKYVVNQLVHFEGKSIDLRVTRNHKMLVQGENKKRHLVPAEHFLCHATTGYDIPLTSSRAKDGNSEFLWGHVPILAYLRFLGWYLSEGSCNRPSGSFFIAQRRGAKREVLKSDLRDGGFSFKENKNGLTVHARSMPDGMKDELRSLGGKYEKRIPRGLLERAGRINLQPLLDRMILGDGNTSKANGAQTYFTSSKQLADDVQELCQYLGYRATVAIRKAKGQGGTVDGRQIKQKHDLYCLKINRKTVVQMAKLRRWLEEIPEGIEVACVQTDPHHTIYVRRNGKAVWCGNSNVVIQIVGSYVDQLVAKIVMGTVAMEPLFVAELVGEFDQQQHAEDQRKAAEEWLSYRCLEPSQINYLPKAIIWARTMVKYGFAAIKQIPEKTIEQVVTDGGGFREFVRHNGPVAYPIMFEDFLMPPTTIELERAPFIAQRSRFERFEIEAMRRDASYDRALISEALKAPTRQGPDRNQQQIENETGAKMDVGNPVVDQWDVYECYFPYTVGGKKFQLISTCIADDNAENPRFVKDVFQWLPDNTLPYIGTRLGSDGERAYGKGFCEMLKDYQEEVTAIHNRRGDASTLANTNLIRIDTGQQIDTQFSIFPNATIPGAKDAIEVIPLGRTANETIKDEQMTLQLAQDRAGVGPSSSGAGGGTVNKKGSYSAMGSFSTMQEGNTRANLNITEFRQSHYCFGRLTLLYDAHFGVEDRDIRAMGKQGRYLKDALDAVREGRLILPIRAATGSVNKEIEKQNLMLLLNNWRAHVQMIAQIMQQLQNPMSPPEYKEYLISTIISGNVLMAKISREFAVPDPSAILPEPLGLQDQSDEIREGFRQQQLAKALQLSLGKPQQAPEAPAAPPAPGPGGQPTGVQ